LKRWLTGAPGTGQHPAVTVSLPAEPAAPAPAPAPAAKVDWRLQLKRLTPVGALGMGILSQVFAKHTVTFAPKAVAFLVIAWVLAAGLGVWLPQAGPDGRHARWRNLLRKAAATVSVSLFRNVLFFLVPVWFASSTLGAANMLAPLALAGVALFSCFPQQFRERVLDRPRVRVAWCSAVLFAALVPAAAVEIAASPRLSAAIAAAVAWTASTLVTSRQALKSRLGRVELATAALVAAGVCALAAPLLPPVPVACREAAAGTGLRNRDIEGQAETFPAGTKRVYAWFAVFAPSHYRQGIRFEWYRDGDRAQRVITKDIVGGREAGFRTSSFISAPKSGAWRVDLLTDASQLIARKRFTVE
jgi:hypothetical protein